MRIFGSDRIAGLMQRLGMEEGVPIEHGMVTKAIERAQKQVEAQNFAIRKHLLEYDDVMNKQRENVYTLRREILEGKIQFDRGRACVDTRELSYGPRRDLIEGLVETHAAKDSDPEEWDTEAFERDVSRVFGLEALSTRSARSRQQEPRTRWRRDLWTRGQGELRGEGSAGRPGDPAGASSATSCCRSSMRSGRTTSTASTTSRKGIGLRGYGQRDPLVEYKSESFELFQAMKARIDEEMVRYFLALRPVLRRGSAGDAAPAPPAAPRRSSRATPECRPILAFAGAGRASAAARPQGRRANAGADGGDDVIKTVKRDEPKVGRNDPCPCGSGKKYKKCHGAGASAEWTCKTESLHPDSSRHVALTTEPSPSTTSCSCRGIHRSCPAKWTSRRG